MRLAPKPTRFAALHLLSFIVVDCLSSRRFHSFVMPAPVGPLIYFHRSRRCALGFRSRRRKNAPGPKTHPLRCAFGSRETSSERALAAISAATGSTRPSESCRGSIITRWPLFPAATGLQRTQESCRGNLDGTHPLTYSYRQFSFRCRPQNAFIAIYTHSVSTNQFISPSIWP